MILRSNDGCCPWCAFRFIDMNCEARIIPDKCPSCSNLLAGVCVDCGKIIPETLEFVAGYSIINGPLMSRIVVHKWCENHPVGWLKWWRSVQQGKMDKALAEAFDRADDLSNRND